MCLVGGRWRKPGATVFRCNGGGMGFRTACAVLSGLATLSLGLAMPCSKATAQYYPAPQVYPPPQGYPSHRPPALPVEDDDDGPFYDPPMIQSRPLPPPDARGA